MEALSGVLEVAVAGIQKYRAIEDELKGVERQLRNVKLFLKDIEGKQDHSSVVAQMKDLEELIRDYDAKFFELNGACFLVRKMKAYNICNGAAEAIKEHLEDLQKTIQSIKPAYVDVTAALDKFPKAKMWWWKQIGESKAQYEARTFVQNLANTLEDGDKFSRDDLSELIKSIDFQDDGDISIFDFSYFLSVFGPFEKCLVNFRKTLNTPWYRGKISSEDARTALEGAGAKKSMIIVRLSQSRAGVVSIDKVSSGGKIKSFRLNAVERKGEEDEELKNVVQWSLPVKNSSENNLHDTLAQLVDHAIKHLGWIPCPKAVVSNGYYLNDSELDLIQDLKRRTLEKENLKLMQKDMQVSVPGQVNEEEK